MAGEEYTGTMISNYSGLCIGGPRDGQWMEWTHDTLRVPELEEPPDMSDPEAWMGVDVKTKIHVYTHRVLFRDSRRSISWEVWASPQMDDGLIVQELFRGYRRAYHNEP